MAKMKTLTINDIQYDVTDDEAVRFTPQELTDEQKAQARKNIEAAQEIYVTPQMYGAVCDGETDDTEALRAMFDAVPNGSTILFPSGVLQKDD